MPFQKNCNFNLPLLTKIRQDLYKIIDMKRTSFDLSFFKALCLLSLILISQAQTPLLQCPDTAVEKRNVMVETPITLPAALSYKYSSPNVYGTTVYELAARLEGQKLFLTVIKEDWKVYEQTKTYTTPVQIVGVKNECVVVKIYSADKSTWTYESIKFVNGVTTPGETPLQAGAIKPLTGFPAGGEIIKVLHFTQPSQQLYIVVVTGSIGNIYKIDPTNGEVIIISSMQTPRIPKILDGSAVFFYDLSTSKFYWLSSSYMEYDTTTIFADAGVTWNPATATAVSIEFYFSGYLSTDPATKKGAFIFHNSVSPKAYAVGGGAVLPRLYGDQLHNLVAYSDKELFWWSFNVAGGLVKTNFVTIYKKIGQGIDSAIADFAAALQIRTNAQVAFLLSANGLKTYRIDASGVKKISESVLSSNLINDMQTTVGKIIATTIACECASDTAPKLICFSTTLNCLMVTRKAFTDCTVTIK